MILSDPSEAAESDRIISELANRFELLERHDLGGTLLHLVLDDIAHNFDAETVVAADALQALFSTEDALLHAGELSSDFVFAVFQKP